jgi:anaerobic magnesium-protoporphyrin IX monomethyl ester cyclase
MPYDGTPIKDELIRTGRFKGDVCHPDYDFIDPRLDDFFHALSRMAHVSSWIHGIGALTPQLQYANAEIAAMRALFPSIPGLEDYRETIRAITRSANELLFRVVEDVSYEFSDGRPSSWSSESVRAECLAFQKTLLLERNSFVADNQAILRRALDPEIPRETSYALST